MVCGKETRPCCPLVFCEDCKTNRLPEVEAVRQRHHEWIEKVIQQRKSKKMIDKISKLETELALYKQPNIALAPKVNPATLANRLVALGWKEIDSYRENVLIFQAEKDAVLYQANIPTSVLLSDYCFAMLRAVEELAKYLRQDVRQVLVDLILAQE
jgi:bifunctional ADP-heptose synthase (sugar kinase/adenylyltransferase)